MEIELECGGTGEVVNKARGSRGLSTAHTLLCYSYILLGTSKPSLQWFLNLSNYMLNIARN